MHGYTQKSDGKNELINKNMSIVGGLPIFILGGFIRLLKSKIFCRLEWLD